MDSHGYNRFTASLKAVNTQRGGRLEYYEMEEISADTILDLLDDIQESETVYSTTDKKQYNVSQTCQAGQCEQHK